MTLALFENRSNFSIISFKQFESKLFNQYAQDYIDFWAVRNSAKIIFDTTTVTAYETSCVFKQILLNLKLKEVHKTKMSHFVVVVNNEKIRNLLQVVFNVVPPVSSYDIVETAADAIKIMDAL